MRILSITAGAAEMYCGSCLRDNALAAELLRQGHDVTLMPVYTPTRVDQENVSEDRVLLGGVSVYLQQHLALFRKTPWLLDRLWDSKFFLNLVSKRSIEVNPKALGALTIGTLLGEHGPQNKEIKKIVHWIRNEKPYEVINLPNAILIGLAGPIKHATGQPLCVTLQGEDLFLEGLPQEHRTRALALIRQQIPNVDMFIAVSDYYKTFMSNSLDIPLDRIRVVPLGVSPEDLSPGGRTRLTSDPFTIGYLARVAPEKSLDLLAKAYRIFRKDHGLGPARLEVAGYLAPEHRPYLQNIENQLRQWGLGNEFHYHGTLNREQKVSFLRSIDVLSVPSTYCEPKGLYLLEAMACGVPVVQPNHGAFPEILERTSGGLLVTPNDPDSLADGLAAIRQHPGQAREMGDRGAANVRKYYSVNHMAERMMRVYSEVVNNDNANASTLQSLTNQ